MAKIEDDKELEIYNLRDEEVDTRPTRISRGCGHFCNYLRDLKSLRSIYPNPRKRHSYRTTAFCLGVDSRFRQRMIRLSDSMFFNHAFLLIVFIQSLYLAANGQYGTGALGSGSYEAVDTFFTVLFSIEMLVKLLAEGLFFGPYAYLTSSWNYLDLFCLTFGWLKYLFDKNYMAVFRSARLLVPLTKLKFIRGLDVMTQCLLASVGQLLEVTAVLIFFFLFFSIIGLQLYMGEFEYRCKNVVTGLWEQTMYQYDPAGLCSTKAGSGRQCDGNNGWKCTNYYENPWFNAISYDNIGTALLTTFVIVSRDGWTRIMYYLDDVAAAPNRVYIIIIVLIGNLFLMNLVVALITLRFDKERSGLAAVIAEKDAKEKAEYEEMLMADQKRREALEQEMMARVEKGDELTEAERLQFAKDMDTTEPLSARIMKLKSWQLLIVASTVGNLALLCINTYNPSEKTKLALYGGHIALTAVFTVECLLKIHALGIKLWWVTGYNRFEAVLTLMLYLEFISRTDESSNLGIFGAISSLRILLILDFMRTWRPIELILGAILRSIKDMLPVLILILFYIYVFAVVGMQQLPDFDEANDRYLRPLTSPQERWPGFSNFWWSCLSVFQVMTGENWFRMMYLAIGFSGWFMAVLFVIMYLLGNVVIMAFLTAVMLGNFAVVADDLETKRLLDAQKKNKDDDKKLEGLPMLAHSLKKLLIKVCCLKKQLAPVAKPPVQSSLAVYSINEEPDEEVKIRALSVEPANYSFSFVSVHQVGRAENEEQRRKTEQAEKAREEEALLSEADKVDLYGTSCCFLWPTHPLRIRMSNMLHHRLYSLIAGGFVILGVVLLAVREPKTRPGTYAKYLMDTGDVLMGAGFLFEFILKWIAFGLYGHKGSYFSNPWHYLDFSIVVVHVAQFIVNVLVDNNLVWRIFQSLIAIRALRVLTAFPPTRNALKAAMLTMPAFIKIVVLAGMCYLIFAIMGIALFAGKFRRCYNPDGFVDFAVDMAHCNGTIGAWINPPAGNFDDIAGAMRTLYQVSTTDGWTEVMFLAIDATPAGQPPEVNYNPAIALFFFVFVLLSAFFVVSIFIALVVFMYMRLINDRSSDDVEQVNHHWMKSWQQILDIVPRRRSEDTIHDSAIRTSAFFAVQSMPWEIVLAVLIVLNTISMCMDVYAAPQSYDDVLVILNICFLGIFTAELLIRWWALANERFWGDNWNKMDVVLVSLSIAGWLIEWLDIDIGFRPRLLRVPRMIRLLRLTRVVKRLQPLTKTIMASFAQLLQILVLLFVLLIMYAYVGMILFGNLKRQKYINSHANFESFGSALQVMFSVATGEDWTQVMHECQLSPPHCTQTDDYLNECGYPTLAIIFFISFTLLATFLFLNLFIAVLLQNFKQSSDLLPTPITINDVRNITLEWSENPYKDSWLAMTLENFISFVENLPLPFGLETYNDDPEVNVRRTCYDLWDYFEEAPIPVRIFTRREVAMLGVDHRERERSNAEMGDPNATDLYIHYGDAMLGIAARQFKLAFKNFDPLLINSSEEMWKSLRRRYQRRFKLPEETVVLPVNGVRAMFMLLGHWRLMNEHYRAGLELAEKQRMEKERKMREDDERYAKEQTRAAANDKEQEQKRQRLIAEGKNPDEEDLNDEKGERDDDGSDSSDTENPLDADAHAKKLSRDKTKSKDKAKRVDGATTPSAPKLKHYEDPRQAVRDLFNQQMAELVSPETRTAIQLAQVDHDVRKRAAERRAQSNEFLSAQRAYLNLLNVISSRGNGENDEDDEEAEEDDNQRKRPSQSDEDSTGRQSNATLLNGAGASNSSFGQVEGNRSPRSSIATSPSSSSTTLSPTEESKSVRSDSAYAGARALARRQARQQQDQQSTRGSASSSPSSSSTTLLASSSSSSSSPVSNVASISPMPSSAPKKKRSVAFADDADSGARGGKR